METGGHLLQDSVPDAEVCQFPAVCPLRGEAAAVALLVLTQHKGACNQLLWAKQLQLLNNIPSAISGNSETLKLLCCCVVLSKAQITFLSSTNWV